MGFGCCVLIDTLTFDVLEYVFSHLLDLGLAVESTDSLAFLCVLSSWIARSVVL